MCFPWNIFLLLVLLTSSFLWCISYPPRIFLVIAVTVFGISPFSDVVFHFLSWLALLTLSDYYLSPLKLCWLRFVVQSSAQPLKTFAASTPFRFFIFLSNNICLLSATRWKVWTGDPHSCVYFWFMRLKWLGFHIEAQRFRFHFSSSRRCLIWLMSNSSATNHYGNGSRTVCSPLLES